MEKRPIPSNVKIFSDKARKVFSGVRFDVFQWDQEMYDGSIKTFETIKRNDTVIILSVVDDHIVLIQEQQPHWDYEVLAAPGGLIEHYESIHVAAKRELEEETGFVFDNFYLVDISFPSPGIEWGRYIFIAKDFKHIQEKKLDGGEKANVVKIHLNKFVEMVRMGELHYPLPFIEKLLLKGEESKVFDMFENPEKYIGIPSIHEPPSIIRS